VAYKNVNNGFYDNNNQAKITEISNEIVIIENQIKQIINKQRRYLNDKKKALNVILNSHKNIDTNLYKQIKKDINFINNELCNYYNSYPFYTSKTSKTLNFFTIIITVIEIIVTTPRVWFTI
jgi:predicted PurR-regulated permease PerM